MHSIHPVTGHHGSADPNARLLNGPSRKPSSFDLKSLRQSVRTKVLDTFRFVGCVHSALYKFKKSL